MDSPAQVQNFYNFLKTLDSESLAQHLIDAGDENAKDTEQLRWSAVKTRVLQENYLEVQKACFDFAGRCDLCRVGPEATTWHPHSVQGTSVFEIDGFPGKHASTCTWQCHFDENSRALPVSAAAEKSLGAKPTVRSAASPGIGSFWQHHQPA